MDDDETAVLSRLSGSSVAGGDVLAVVSKSFRNLASDLLVNLDVASVAYLG